ncbi:uncharacterized protein LOC121867338 [Homarus americanus]|uniref:uncharacterized protein LOC121867338 n=1 Tax=Homarus americanus TaxID=6706 RepID=UPI001C490824|nr:uncharacterized protein LOC121867338 [Homarus americanus]
MLCCRNHSTKLQGPALPETVARARKHSRQSIPLAVGSTEGGTAWGVEQDVRKRNTELEVWTGTYGVLERPQPMFLNKNTVPVPAYIWKMIYDREKKSTDIIVLVNDITGNGTLKGAKLNAAPFCTDKNENCACFPCPIRNVREEQIFCCDANVLRNTIKYLPTVPAIPKDGLRSY